MWTIRTPEEIQRHNELARQEFERYLEEGKKQVQAREAWEKSNPPCEQCGRRAPPPVVAALRMTLDETSSKHSYPVHGGWGVLSSRRLAMEKAIETLLGSINQDTSADDALKYTQAVLNLVNAGSSIANSPAK